jgi:HEAT repeat protein
VLAAALWIGAVGSAGAAPPRAPQRTVQATPAEVGAIVEGLLMGYEPGDPGEALRRLGAPAADVLLRLAQDAKTPPLRRLRAIEALQHVPTPAGREYLSRLIAERRTATASLAVYELAAAARGLAGFGAPAAPELTPLLASDSADVREGAAYALGKIRTPEALSALQARLRVETESGVREALGRALRR